MADVVLNLIYNDNGAQNAINSIVNQLRQVETKQWKINLDYAPVRSFATEFQKASSELDKLVEKTNRLRGSFSNSFVSGSFNDLADAVQKYERRVEAARRSIINWEITNKARKNLGLDISGDIERLTQNFKIAKEEARIARSEFDKLGSSLNLSGKGSEIMSLAEKMKHLSNTTRESFSLVQNDVKRGWDFSYITPKVEKQVEKIKNVVTNGFSFVPVVSENAKKQLMEGWDDMPYLSPREEEDAHGDEIEQSLEEQKKRVADANAAIALGYKQTWIGIQQIIVGTLRTLQNAYNTWKSVVEAPLNLTGVSTLVSMLESLQGSLVLNQISSNFTSGFSQGVERFDILRSFPAVMESIGYSADEASMSMNRLYQSVLGLPTSFGDIVENAQFFTLVFDDLEKATNLAIAANNSFVASGANSQQISSGMRQLQYIIEGTKLRSTQWYSLIRSMPLALREVAKALDYPDFSKFTEDLMSGTIESETLIDTLIDVGLHSEKLGGIIDVMKGRITAALENVTNAGRRMGSTLLETLDTVLQREGGKGITENIRGISGVIDHITEVASNWISEHGEEIQSLVDKFFNIDWASIVPGFLEGLVDVANKALDNIGKWIEDIGGILDKVKTTFNSIENSSFVKIITGIVGSLGSIAQIFTGRSTAKFGSSLIKAGLASGGSLSSAISTGTAGTAGALGVAGTFGAAGIGAAIGLTVGSVTDYVYEVLDNGVKQGTINWARNWRYVTPAATAVSLFNDFSMEFGYNISAVLNGFNFVGKMLDVAKENRLPQRFRRMQLYSGRIADISNRYGSYDFADESTVDFLNTLSEYLANFEINGTEGNRINRSFSKLSSTMNMIDLISKPYDDAIKKLESRRTELLELIDDINEEIQKRFAGVDINTNDFYKKLYDTDKKFFSEQYEEASKWGYANTTRDRADTIEKLLPKATRTISDITEYALENYGDNEEVLAVVAQYMADFDYNDPNKLKQLVENFGGKSMQQVFEEYFEQQARNLSLDEAFRTALLTSQQTLTEQQVEGINIQQENLEEQKKTAISPYIEELEEDIDELHTQFDSAINTVKERGTELVNAINGIFSALNSSEAIEQIDTYYGSILNSINRWMFRIRNASYHTNESVSRGGQTAPYATGGYLFHPIGTDTIPAMLTPGEYVHRRAAVEHFGRMFMDRINNLDLNGALRALHISVPYATGGFVKNDSRSYRDNHAVVNQVFNSANASTGFRRASRYVRALG